MTLELTFEDIITDPKFVIPLSLNLLILAFANAPQITYTTAKLENIEMHFTTGSSYMVLTFVDNNSHTYHMDVNNNFEFFKEHIGDWFKLKLINGEIKDITYLGGDGNDN